MLNFNLCLDVSGLKTFRIRNEPSSIIKGCIRLSVSELYHYIVSDFNI